MTTHCKKRMKPLFWTAAALVGVGMAAWGISQADAQPGGPDGPPPHGHHGPPPPNPLAEVPFELHLDLAKAYDSPLGQMFWEIVKEQEPRLDEFADGLVETIGLDPRTDVGEVTLRGEGGPDMVNGIELVADLGESTGKIEGWLLTLPGYESDDLDDETLLHSFVPEDGPGHHGGPDGFGDGAGAERGHEGPPPHRVWVAMPRGEDGRYVLIASLNEDATVGRAEEVLAGEAVVESVLEGDEVFSLRVEDLAEHGLPKGAPGSAVLESVEGLSLTVGSGDEVTAELNLEMVSPVRARQVTQLLQGLAAAVQLAALEEPEAQPLADFLSEVQIDVDEEGESPAVSASFSGPQEEVEGWLWELIENDRK